MAKSMHDSVVDSLREHQSELEKIEEETGISKWTMLKILQRQIENPGVKSIEILDAYFKARRRNRRKAA